MSGARLVDGRLGSIELDGDGHGEALVPLGAGSLWLTVEWVGAAPGAEVDLLGEDPAELAGRALGWAMGGGHETVELYLAHHAAEFTADEVEALVSGGGPEASVDEASVDEASVAETGATRASAVEGLRGALEPVALHVRGGAGERELVVDLGFGPDVTEVLLAVRVDPGGSPVGVDAVQVDAES